MSSIYDMFETDPSVEKEGAHVVYGGTRITVARAGGANKKYQIFLEAVTKPHRRLIDQGLLPSEQGEKIAREALCKTVILGWEESIGEDGKPDDGASENYQPGIRMKDGTILPVTPENMEKFFLQPGMMDVFRDLQKMATDNSLFLAQVREEAAKNS